MGLPRSTFYANQVAAGEDPAVAEIHDIVTTCKGYGYRRVTAELRHRGMIVNSKKVRRIMRENGWNPKRKQRYVITTDSNHDSPIYPNVARGFEVHGPDQLWVGDITYIALETGFCYLSVILDVWSRKCGQPPASARRFALPERLPLRCHLPGPRHRRRNYDADDRYPGDAGTSERNRLGGGSGCTCRHPHGSGRLAHDRRTDPPQKSVASLFAAEIA